MRERPGSWGSDSAESVDDLSELEGLDPDDYLTELGSRIVRMAAHQAALEYRLLVLIAEFDRREGWAADGHNDCAAWLEMFTGMSRITARCRWVSGSTAIPRNRGSGTIHRNHARAAACPPPPARSATWSW